MLYEESKSKPVAVIVVVCSTQAEQCSSMMEDLLNMSGGQNTALVIFAFLQAGSSNSEYNKELLSLGSGINLNRDINFNGSRIDTQEEGDLETDGHPMSSPLRSFNDLRPSADLEWPSE